jgi:hypothetical protein
LIRDGGSAVAPSVPDLPIAWTKRVTDDAVTMQAAPCGHRLGISGQFRETLVTNFPHMRQPKDHEATPFAKRPQKHLLIHAFGPAAA